MSPFALSRLSHVVLAYGGYLGGTAYLFWTSLSSRLIRGRSCSAAFHRPTL